MPEATRQTGSRSSQVPRFVIYGSAASDPPGVQSPALYRIKLTPLDPPDIFPKEGINRSQSLVN